MSLEHFVGHCVAKASYQYKVQFYPYTLFNKCICFLQDLRKPTSVSISHYPTKFPF